jgi:CheY-like chemotaxis protein
MANILIIDDMAGVRRAVATTLKRAGHTVTEAGDGESGLRLVAEQSFDLVVTDIVMPGMDGTEVIMSLASRPDRPMIIAMSGGGAHVTSEEALILAKQTADASLAKPFGGSELIDMIERVLSKRGQQACSIT